MSRTALRTALKTTKAIATAIERRSLIPILAAVALLIGSSGCGSKPPPSESDTNSRNTSHPVSGCLEQFKAENLDEVLRRCNASVAAHPDEPGPLSERALVLSLKGETTRACADVAKGLKLLERSGQHNQSSSNPMLRYELDVRHAACKQDRTIDANG